LVPCRPRHGRARRVGARTVSSRLHAYPKSATPPRPCAASNTRRWAGAGGRGAARPRRGRGRDSNLNPVSGFLLCPSGRPATPTPRIRHDAARVGLPAWGRGRAASGGRQTRHWRLGRADQEKRLGARPSPRGRRPSLRCRRHRPPCPATPTTRAPSVGWRLAWSPLSSPKRRPSPPVARLPFVQAPPTAMTLTTSARLFGAL